jgi:hypothetical protein
MGAATALPVRDVRVDPGATTTATMLVRNTGQVVDQFTIDVVGNSAEWTKVEPRVVNLLPGADVEVTVTFAPAKSPLVPAGVVPFGLRVVSREDPPGSTVAEGTIDVAPFDDVQVELVPRQSRGSRKGKHQVAVDNNGNQPTTVEVTATDEEEALNFKMDHRLATLEPGAGAFIRLVAKPEKRFLKGADRQHPFVVTVVPSNTAPVATRGTMSQKQLLPAWLIPAIAILAVLAIVGFVLYQTLLKPQIDTAAKNAAAKAVKSQNSSLVEAASSAQAQAAAAQSQAKQAQGAASQALKSASAAASAKGGGATSPAGGTGPGGAVLANGTATAFSLQTDTAPTAGNFTSFTVTPGPTIGSKKVLVITAVVMQNPNGDTGTLQIQRGSGEILLTEGLANFRDLDHHFDDEPLVFTSATPLRVAVNCQSTTTTHCHPSILFTGRFVTKPAA